VMAVGIRVMAQQSLLCMAIPFGLLPNSIAVDT
jgi:hypothetical protein